MNEKLKWNAIGLVKKTQILRDYLQNQKNNIPIDHTSKSSKFLGYLAELNHLLEQMEKIEKIIIPKVLSTLSEISIEKKQMVSWH